MLPPPELSLALECQTWGSLPEPGSLRDQWAGEYRRMKVAYNVYTTMSAFNRALAAHRQSEWLEANPNAGELVRAVMKMQHERDKRGDRGK